MSKVYVVMHGEECCGEEFGPHIEKIFDSKEKAIKYINDVWSDRIITYDGLTEEYYYKLDDYTMIYRFIEEYEVQ